MAFLGTLTKQQKLHGALLLANIFFGTGAVIGALGLPATHPLVFALLREIGAGWILLSVSMYLYQRTAINASDEENSTTTISEKRDKTIYFPNVLTAWIPNWKNFALLGLVLFGNQAGFIVGIKLAGPVTASVWQPSQPLFTSAICMALGLEPFQRKRLVGVIVASIGCVFMVLLKTPKVKEVVGVVDTSGNPEQDGAAAVPRYAMGNALFFLNCLCTSLYVIMSKRMLKLYPPLMVAAWSYNGAAILMFFTVVIASSLPGADPFFCPECSPVTNPIRKVFHIPHSAIPALFYFIVFGSVASYGLITWANQHATGTLVMSYTVLQPVTSVFLTSTLLPLGVVVQCTRSAIAKGVACLDYPNIGTICGMLGVFAGLRIIIATEPSHDKSQGEKDKKTLEVEVSPLLSHCDR